jgi:hypothetical protein
MNFSSVNTNSWCFYMRTEQTVKLIDRLTQLDRAPAVYLCPLISSGRAPSAQTGDNTHKYNRQVVQPPPSLLSYWGVHIFTCSPILCPQLSTVALSYKFLISVASKSSYRHSDFVIIHLPLLPVSAYHSLCH